MPEQTLLGFDWGEKRIGVAIGNTITGQASALKVISVPQREARFAAIADLIADWQPNLLVVGMPYHPDGTAHEMTARCRRFAQQLQGRFRLPVVTVDERYSSVVAQASQEDVAQANRSEKCGLDALAAQIILQQYLDHHDTH